MKVWKKQFLPSNGNWAKLLEVHGFLVGVLEIQLDFIDKLEREFTVQKEGIS